MKVVMLGFVGLVLGAVLGGIVGILLGLLWTEAFQTSSFEGSSGMLVFFTFMPIGVSLGALAGALALGVLVSQSPAVPVQSSKRLRT